MNFGNIPRYRIFALVGLLVLIAGVIAGVVLIMGGGLSLVSKAGPTATPRQVTVTNIDSDTFTVSWISDTNVSGFIKYGTTADDLDQTLSDDRDQLSGSVGLTTTHYVTTRSLQPNTTYYFALGSGSEVYNDIGGTPYQVTTPATLAKPPTDVISGKVLLPNGQPAPGALVYISMDGAATRSAQTRASGVWTLPLSQTRTTDLTSYFSYDPGTTQLNIFVQAADLGTATAIVTTANDNPVPDIILGESLEMPATASAGLTGMVITIENNVLTPNSLTVKPSEIVTVINKDGINHNLVSVGAEFDTGAIGGGGNATFLAPAGAGTYAFFDSLNPEIETLKGTLTVATGEETVGAGFGELTTLPEIDEAYEATLSVKLVTPIDQGELIATSTPEFKVSGPVGQTVTITVRSDPQSQTVAIDADGQIEFTPPEGLEPGEHTLEVEYVDQNGVLQKITRTFVVLAAEGTTGQGGLPAFTSTPSATLAPSPTSTPSPTATISGSMPSTSAGVPESGVLTLTLTIFMMGVALFIAGVFWQIRLIKS